MTAELISAEDALDRLTRRLRPGDEVALDTEFMRERTYQAVLCLVQLSADDKISMVDPLAEITLDDFWSVLCKTNVVLHAGRQDLEVMYQASGKLPAALFDTQIAAGLSGLAPQCGYATLVEAVCDVKLAKAHTRENWARRPFRSGALAYASEDVLYLPRLKAHFLEQLDKLNRQSWAEEDTQALLDPELYHVDTSKAWSRLKGLGRLAASAQHRAAALAGWREKVAMERNLPRGWIVRDPELLQIAALDKPDRAAIIDVMESERNAKRHASAMLSAMNNTPTDATALVTRAAPPDADEKQAAKVLATRIGEIATELDLQPELLAPMKEIRAAIAGERDLRLFRGWRAEVCGESIAASLDNGQLI